MLKTQAKILFFACILFTFTLFSDFVFAEDLAVICQLDAVELSCKSLSPADCKKLLEKCENYYQQESDRVSQDLNQTSKEKTSLKNKIGTLAKKIKDLDYRISQSNLIIKDLKIQISDTEGSILKTTDAIEKSTAKLNEILRTIGQEDKRPAVEVLLFEKDLTEFFNNLASLDILSEKGSQYLTEIKALKANLEEQKASLDGEKSDLEQTVKLNQLQKQESDKTKKQQEYYLGITEQEYQSQLKEKASIEKKANEIRARLFELVGVSKAPTFGEAYEIAKYVSGVTGVRPAFLLAVLQQESAIGKNVGQCILTDTITGAGKRISTNATLSNVMKPSRDVQPFIQITAALGKQYSTTPVSCPIASVGGYGGAMGPAQFIPSTWVIYSSRLQSILGKAGDPWSIKDSFLAAALYLTDRGALTKKYNDEWKSALAYFSGSTKSNSKYNFYANSVMNIAAGFENDIAALQAANLGVKY